MVAVIAQTCQEASSVRQNPLTLLRSSIEQVDPVKNVVTIQGGRQNKFCSDRHRGVSCSADAPDKWEMFTVEYVGSDTVALKGGRLGKYCAVNPAPVLDMRGEEISFKSVANGMFCSDLYNGVFAGAIKCRVRKHMW